MLTIPTDTETPRDMLPARLPDVTTVRRLAPDPPPPRHRTLVSDCHEDTSQELLPSLPASLAVRSPMLDPCSVTLKPPVLAWFAIRITLTFSVSTLSALVTLPTRRPAVADIRLLPAAPCPPWHRNEVSDSHVVLSHADCPARNDPLRSAHPIPAPHTVTLLPPVAPIFVLSTTLPTPKSAEYASVTLAARLPVLTCIRLLPATPCPTWHRTDVSPSHAVCSHPV